MHVNAKKIAIGGLLLALTEVCIALGSVIETNTLFLLAAASYFVGFSIRETDIRTGAVFYAAGVLPGILISPNKLYVISYAAMGFYILAIELIWKRIGQLQGERNRAALFWGAKYVIFNLLFLPMVFGFREVFFPGTVTPAMLLGIVAAGQAGLFVYDRAYEYAQAQIWSRMRKIL